MEFLLREKGNGAFYKELPWKRISKARAKELITNNAIDKPLAWKGFLDQGYAQTMFSEVKIIDGISFE